MTEVIGSMLMGEEEFGKRKGFRGKEKMKGKNIDVTDVEEGGVGEEE